MATNFNMKGLEEKFWKRVRILAINREVSIKELILNCLKKEVDKEDKE